MSKAMTPHDYPTSVAIELEKFRKAVRACKRPLDETESVSNEECTCNLDLYRRRIEWLMEKWESLK